MSLAKNVLCVIIILEKKQYVLNLWGFHFGEPLCNEFLPKVQCFPGDRHRVKNMHMGFDRILGNYQSKQLLIRVEAFKVFQRLRRPPLTLKRGRNI